MDIDIQFRSYELVKKLTEQGFQIIVGDAKTDEIWMERKANRKSSIVRVKPQTFDWSNQLRQDLQTTYQQMQRIRQAIYSTNTELYTIYIANEHPVDEWEELKAPIGEGNKKSPRMHMYYLEQGNEREELNRLGNDLHIYISLHADAGRKLDEAEKEATALQTKNTLFQRMQEEQEKREKVFSFSKPLFTYVLIVLNVLMFIFQLTSGDLENRKHLIDMGANYNQLVMEGEWWRFFSSMFLHLDFIHLLMNMIALFYLGSAIERIFGRMRFLFIYFLGGLTGSIASFALSVNVSAGASGAIFALFGALLLFGLIYKQIFFQTMGLNIILILAINLVIGFTSPEIDMGAHIGGLVGGFLIAAAAYVPSKKNTKNQLLGFICFIIISTGLFIYGWSANTLSAELKLIEAEMLTEEENFSEVISITTEALGETDDPEVLTYLLFRRSYAYIQEYEYSKATADLEDAIQYEEVFPEVYYNLAILYSQQGASTEEIEAVIDEGLDQFPGNEDLEDLKEDL